MRRGRLLSFATAFLLVGEAAADVSLNGLWRFRGLESSATPFPPVSAAERALLGTNCDDRAWAEIRVPLNWWRDPRFGYGRYAADQCYFRGYYRRSLVLDRPHDGRRILRFEEIGAEADLFVNGRHGGHHLGDFTPWEVDVTDLLHSGTNALALRVLADFGPDREKGEAYVRIYGAHWDRTVVKGGLWHDVTLRETPALRFTSILLDVADDLQTVAVRCRVANPGAPDTLTPAVCVTALVGGETVGRAVGAPVTLGAGETDFALSVHCPNARPWSPETPVRYVATVELRRAGKVVSADSARIGFRTMHVVGRDFVFNGRKTYLVGDSVHSSSYGGFGGDPTPSIRERLLAQRRNGVTILRTAHMPVVPEFYELADELGMMIYDEWGCCFCNRIDAAAFARNNPPALERWIRRDYNHPSVVLWSLGNEVKHGNDEAISQALDRQYDAVKALDRQNRPVCAFSGVADVALYGRRRLKTDFLDLHSYCGIDGVPWSHWFATAADRYFKPMTAVYGEGGHLAKPVVMWECVGGGWGVESAPDVKPGDVAHWLDWMNNRAPRWSRVQDNAVCFSPATGLFPLLDPQRGALHLQSTLGRRLCELFRQDDRLAGFAPWFVNPKIPGIARWQQRVYPLLRLAGSGTGALMPHQWTSPDARNLECVVVNATADALSDVRIDMAFGQKNGCEVPLQTIALGKVAPFETRVHAFALRLPARLPSAGEIRLCLTDGAKHQAWNGYDVVVHPADASVRLLVGTRRVTLAAHDADCERLLADMGVAYAVTTNLVARSDVLLVPPNYAADDDMPLRAFVRDGGTLVVLEPPVGPVVGFGELCVAERANPLVEPVALAHPLFDGLTADDFDTWAENPCGDVMRCGVTPPDAGVLAGIWNFAAVTEHAYGKGRVIVSTLSARGIQSVNPSARRFLRNLVAYVTAPAAHAPVPAGRLADMPPRARQQSAPQPLVVAGTPRTVEFPASSEEHHPATILFFEEALPQLASGRYRFLTLTLRARTRGRVDVTLPERNHRNRLSHVLALTGGGHTLTYRLDLKEDFAFAKPGAFALDALRGEVILYNGGAERTRGLGRPPCAFDLLDCRFE